MIRLSQTTLDDLPSSIRRPLYDRSSLTPGIVHIGLGNFQRAHQAWYLQQLFNKGIDQDWAVIGAGLRPYDARQRLKILDQNCLSTLIELAPAGMSAEVVGSMIDYIEVDNHNTELIKWLSDPAIRIVSLTVTEGGYYIEPATKQFERHHRDIVHDISNMQHPRTAFGAIIAAAKIRRDRRLSGLTCLSLDNFQANGEVLRRTVLSLADACDPQLAQWIEEHFSFPCSMVDCIVPQSGVKELDLVQKFGIDDAVPVTHENYRQWVVEDDFRCGRPNWERVGVMFSENVHAHEKMKIRMLNAGHQMLANAGEILSIGYISQCIKHDLICAAFSKVQQNEIAVHIQGAGGTTPQDYLKLLIRRFSNDAVRDTTRRVAYDGSARHPQFVLPSVRDSVSSGDSIEGLALIEALWARMCEGTREDGSVIKPNDPHWNELKATAQKARYRPHQWLNQSRIYGDIAQVPRFSDAFTRWLDLIWTSGCKAALSRYIAS